MTTPFPFENKGLLSCATLSSRSLFSATFCMRRRYTSIPFNGTQSHLRSTQSMKGEVFSERRGLFKIWLFIVFEIGSFSGRQVAESRQSSQFVKIDSTQNAAVVVAVNASFLLNMNYLKNKNRKVFFENLLMGIKTTVFRRLEMAGDFKNFGSIFANWDIYLFLPQFPISRL